MEKITTTDCFRHIDFEAAEKRKQSLTNEQRIMNALESMARDIALIRYQLPFLIEHVRAKKEKPITWKKPK